MKHTVIFVGPSLGKQTYINGDVAVLPPAARGDLLHAWRLGARRILLIDGTFEQNASVWHKEIEFCLSRGIQVVGASSMGALRAAELSGIGMEGVGAVFDLFSSGLLQDDDEVAVLHAGAELNWMTASEAMVDIRHGVAMAVSEGTLSEEAGAQVVDEEKARYFGDRSWRYFQECEPTRMASEPISLKRSDAIRALNALNGTCFQGGALGSIKSFHWSTFFECLWTSVHSSSVPTSWAGNWLPKHERIALEAAQSTWGPAYKLHAKMAQFCIGLPTIAQGSDEALRLDARRALEHVEDWFEIGALRTEYTLGILKLFQIIDEQESKIGSIMESSFYRDARFLVRFLTSHDGSECELLVKQIALLWSRIDLEAKNCLRLRSSTISEWIGRIRDAPMHDDATCMDEVARIAARVARLFSALGADTRIVFGSVREPQQVNWLTVSSLITYRE